MAIKYYDVENHRLVFIHQQATEEYWDEHWDKYDVEKVIKSASSSRFLLGNTRKYLRPGARILEGGCGLGQYVYCLHTNGYESYGIDYAAKTVQQVNQVVPELKVFVGDVRELPFGEGFFDGYWSLGVIEHFYDGFGHVALEMRRVVRPGGYVFLTFPCLSILRRIKIRLGRYEAWVPKENLISHFYQFALSGTVVCQYLQSLGFRLVKRRFVEGLKGLKDEVGITSIQSILRKIYNSSNFANRVFAYSLSQILAPLTGHCELMVLQRMK